jgi:HlyD family secretion protein
LASLLIFNQKKWNDMDRELSADYVKKTKIKKIVTITSIVLGFILIFWLFRSFITPTLNRSRIRTAIAEMGDVETTINASGIVIPEYEQIITSPIQSKILAVHYQAGELVKAGGSILELDMESIENEYNKLIDENELKRIEINKQKLEVSRILEELNSRSDVKKLRVKSLESSLEREKKLLEIGASTPVSVDRADLNLQIEKRELVLLEKQIENQKSTLNAELQKLELELQILTRTKNELKNKLEESFIRADKDGVITWIKKEIGVNVNSGEIIAKVADLNSFKVEATISDIHANKLLRKGSVRVRVGNKDFTGHIEAISPGVNAGLVNFLVLLDDKTNPMLRPNMRVEVFVILSKSKSVVRIKNGPFFTTTSNHIVYIVKRGLAHRVQTEFGASNFDFVELKRGIEPGDEVIISNMEEYYHMQEIEIDQ